MAQNATIRPQQIERARKQLQEKGDDTCRKTNLGKASFIVPDTSDEDL